MAIRRRARIPGRSVGPRKAIRPSPVTLPLFVLNGTEVDVGSHITPTPAGLTINGGTSNWGETLFYLTAAETRAAGLAGIIAVRVQDTTHKFVVGWRNNADGTYYGLQFHSDGKLYLLNDQAPDAPGLEVGSYGVADYEIIPQLRANGVQMRIKGGAFTDWTLLYNTVTGNDATLHLAVSSYDAALAVTNIQALGVQPSTWLASDGFQRSNGALGGSTTDGQGHPEGGGTGRTWVAQQGNWDVSSNHITPTAVASGAAIATLDLGVSNVVAEAKLTSTGAQIGILLNYVDANNYAYAHINVAAGAARLRKRVGGSDTANLITGAISYGAGKRLVVVKIGITYRLYYDEAFIGTTTITDAVFNGVTLFGVYCASNGSVLQEDDVVFAASA